MTPSGPGQNGSTGAVRQPDRTTTGDAVPFGQALRAWFTISLQTFGGPAGQIAVMQRHLVEERRWIGQRRFLHALNYCMVLPGPEAQQLAIYVGWLLNGVRGGLVAGILFVLPGAVALLALSAIYVAFGDTKAVTAVFAGLAPAVVAIVAQAVWRIGSRALSNPVLVGFAVVSFLALAAFGVLFPLVIAAAAVGGWALHRWRPSLITTGRAGHPDQHGPAPLISDDALHHAPPSLRGSSVVLVIGLLAWFVPVGVVAAATGIGSVYTEQALFFSGTAVVTFGGAYAVLAYVAQRAVEHYAWLSADDMVRGLALAETTPGPLIMVVQFVAFLGAYHDPGSLSPWVGAVVASLLTTWVTFVPCFLFVLLGAPYVERLRSNHALSAALTGITAAVVGVIANLGLYFALNTFFVDTFTVAAGPFHLRLPDVATARLAPIVIAVLAAVLTFRLKWSVLRVLAVCAAAGLAAGIAGVPGA
jgi:chromate transporter